MVLANTRWSKNPYRLKFFLANNILANSFIFSVGDALRSYKWTREPLAYETRI